MKKSLSKVTKTANDELGIELVSKCPACGFSFNDDKPLHALMMGHNKELFSRLFNLMKTCHKYDGSFQYKMFLQAITQCDDKTIESVIKKFIAEKKYFQYGLPYLRGWIVRENERQENKKTMEKKIGGVHPPEIKEE